MASAAICILINNLPCLGDNSRHAALQGSPVRFSAALASFRSSLSGIGYRALFPRHLTGEVWVGYLWGECSGRVATRELCRPLDLGCFGTAARPIHKSQGKLFPFSCFVWKRNHSATCTIEVTGIHRAWQNGNNAGEERWDGCVMF